MNERCKFLVCAEIRRDCAKRVKKEDYLSRILTFLNGSAPLTLSFPLLSTLISFSRYRVLKYISLKKNLHHALGSL